MRGFHHIQNVLSVVVMLFIAVIWGVAAAPGYLIVMWIRDRVVGEGLLMEAIGTVSYTHLTLPTICSV